MKQFILSLILAACTPAYAQNSGQTNSATNNPGWSGSKNFVKNPDCAKNTSGITASGGSLTRSTTTPINGDAGAECAIDASADAQTFTWALNTFDQGMKGQNCEARFHYEGDASYYKAYVVNGSSQVTADLQLAYNSSAVTPVSINFPCGDLSASNTLVIKSTNASAAAISVGRVYVGLATNLGLVNPITDWISYTPTFTGLGTVTIAGSYYKRVGDSLEIKGRLTTGTATGATITMTLPSGLTHNAMGNTVVGSGWAQGLTSKDFFINTSSTNLFQFFSNNGAGIALVGTDIGNSQVIDFYITNVRITGWGTQQAISSNQTPWYVDATMDGANPSLGTANVSSYTEITDASLTLKPQTGSQAVGVMCSSTNAATAPSTSNTTCAAGSESVGINFAIPTAGAYEVCFYGAHWSQLTSGDGLNLGFQIIETPTNAQTLTLEGGTRQYVGGTAITIASGVSDVRVNPISNCSIFNWTSSGSKGVRLMYEQSIISSPDQSLLVMDASSSYGQPNARWTVKPITNQQPQPLLVGSVTSNSSGLERVERLQFNKGATTNCNSSPCTIAAQSGSAFTGVTRGAAGQYTVTATSGLFSSAPMCTCSSWNNGVGGATCTVSVSSATSIAVYTYTPAGSAQDAEVWLICQGPR